MNRRPILGLTLTILLVPTLATRAAAATQLPLPVAANVEVRK